MESSAAISKEAVKELANEQGLISLRARECQLSFWQFVQEFWSEVVLDEPVWNWHIPYLCGQLQIIAERVADGLPKEDDFVTNIPPGTTKSLLFTVFFPAYCWTRWPWMRFIKASYSAALSLEHAETCRDLVKAEKYQDFFPYVNIKKDKDTKSNFRVVFRDEDTGRWRYGGNLYSTSVGGTVTGFHGHILLVDDPLDPDASHSDKELERCNRWMNHTLPSRKTNKEVTPTIMIMQRLHEADPTGDWLSNPMLKIKHVCLPGEVTEENKDDVKPQELLKFYKDGLLDPKRFSRKALDDFRARGQYVFSSQIQQRPTPPEGGMFQPDQIKELRAIPNPDLAVKKVIYWDKAGSEDAGAHTCGVEMWQMEPRYPLDYVIVRIDRGQWGTHKREEQIRHRAEQAYSGTITVVEQEPGSGGKESAERTIRNLAGHAAAADRPTGNKTFRADPFSVQVNWGNVGIVEGLWVKEFKDELRFYPYSKFMDQVDASSGAFNQLAKKKVARAVGRKRAKATA
jgi:predicted phage terminase large subunit-like protein